MADSLFACKAFEIAMIVLRGSFRLAAFPRSRSLSTFRRMSSTTANGVMPLTSRASEPALTGVDPVQAALMEERLIVLDYNDKPIGEASKKTCMYLLLISAKYRRDRR